MSNLDFDNFLEQRTAAAGAYAAGDPAPVDALVAKEGAATFHSPLGDTVFGAAAVAARYRNDAASFKAGGVTRFEILQQEFSGDLGFWTGFQVATVQFAGQDKPIEMKIRVTEVFRRRDGEWKIVHRHADVPQKAR